MLYLLLFVPAILAAAFLLRPKPATIAEEAVPENAFDSLEQALTELERARLDDLDELERLADLLETTARQLERVA